MINRKNEKTVMNRIAIIGSPGSGKSTLARTLYSITKIKLIHLDLLFWKPGWIEMPREDWIVTQQKLIQDAQWIIDGTYQSTLDIRLKAADTIIFLDTPRLVCILRVIKRHLFYLGRSRPDLVKGCSEKLTWEYLKKVWNFTNNERATLIEKLLSASQEQQIVWLTSKKDITVFLEKLRIEYQITR